MSSGQSRLVLAVLTLLAIAAAGNNQVPTYLRGVEFSRIPLYNQGDEFRCLDGSKTILADQVNDDYCDCPDGSDEPGTSACPEGRFFCSNKGHASEYIPSSRVNDKICDCCDGSDEWGSSTTCSNICDELGKSAREEKERLAIVARKGFTTRKELAKQGLQMKEEKVNAAMPIRTERDGLQPEKDVLLAKKNEAEEKERKLKDEHNTKWQATKDEKKKEKAGVFFKEIDTDGDGKISLPEMEKLTFLDADHDGIVSETEAKLYFTVEEADFDYFLTNMYESLKLTKRNYEHDMKEGERKPEDDDMVAEEDKAIPEPEDIPDTEEDEDDVMPAYEPETQAAIDEADAARKAYNEIETRIRDFDSQIREADSFTSQDFGTDFAWAPLKGQCFELNDLQYTYKLCPFEKTIQKDKNGYGETNLGNFKDWSGPVPRKYSIQKYDGGQQCWNGPQRSTEVIIECGETNELISASEPAKCEYQFVFRTPAACNDPDHEEPVHVEL